MSELDALREDRIAGTLSALQNMHKEVAGKISAVRRCQIEAHNRKTHVKPCNFGVGDYVLRGVRAGQRRSKLALRWTGPYRVVKVQSEFVFVLEHILSGDRVDVHGSRIMFFRNSSFDEVKEMEDHVRHQEGELHSVAKFVGFRAHEGVPQVKIRWEGFEVEDDSWEDIKLIREDVPVLFKNHVKDCRRSGSAADKEFLRTHRI